jgi:hypothetical protein
MPETGLEIVIAGFGLLKTTDALSLIVSLLFGNKSIENDEIESPMT